MTVRMILNFIYSFSFYHHVMEWWKPWFGSLMRLYLGVCVCRSTPNAAAPIRGPTRRTESASRSWIPWRAATVRPTATADSCSSSSERPCSSSSWAPEKSTASSPGSVASTKKTRPSPSASAPPSSAWSPGFPGPSFTAPSSVRSVLCTFFVDPFHVIHEFHSIYRLKMYQIEPVSCGAPIVASRATAGCTIRRNSASTCTSVRPPSSWWPRSSTRSCATSCAISIFIRKLMRQRTLVTTARPPKSARGWCLTTVESVRNPCCQLILDHSFPFILSH